MTNPALEFIPFTCPSGYILQPGDKATAITLCWKMMKVSHGTYVGVANKRVAFDVDHSYTIRVFKGTDVQPTAKQREAMQDAHEYLDKTETKRVVVVRRTYLNRNLIFPRNFSPSK